MQTYLRDFWKLRVEGRILVCCPLGWAKGRGICNISVPAGNVAYFQTNGKISDNILGNLWRQINQEFLPQSQYDKCGLPTIERYVFWNEAEDAGEVEVWIPVKD